MNTRMHTQTKPPYGLIAVLLIGAFISFLNNTLMNVALPSIMEEFRVGPSNAQWVTTGYMLVSGIMIPTTAFLIAKYSVRHLFLASMGLFSIGTLIAGFSPVFPVLILGRMVQASGASVMMPVLMNVLLVSFPIEKRGTAMGIFGFILSFAPAIGPTLSGWIVQSFGWRNLFFMIAPISFVILILGFLKLHDKKEKSDLRLDKLSILLSCLGFGGLLFGFSSAGGKGWGSPNVIIPIVIGFITLVWFILRQFKLTTPMLDFRIYRYPMFALSSVIIMIFQMALFAGFMLLPIFAETVKGIEPMKVGLMLLPGALINAGMSLITGRLFDKFGGKGLALTDLTIVAISTYLFSQLNMETGYYHIMVIHAIRMFGLSMIMMPVQTNGLNQLPRQYYPHGTAMNNTLNQVSAALGTSVVMTIMTMRQNALTEQLMSGHMNRTTEEITKLATTGGINLAFFISTIIIIFAIVLTLFMKRAIPGDVPNQKVQPETTMPVAD